MEELQNRLQKVEVLGDKLLTVGEKIVDCDKRRQGDREALSALRKLGIGTAPTPGPSSEQAARDKTRPKPPQTLWMFRPGGVAMRLPSDAVHKAVTLDYDEANRAMEVLQAEQKALVRSLQTSGVVPESVGQELLRAMLDLKDDVLGTGAGSSSGQAGSGSSGSRRRSGAQQPGMEPVAETEGAEE